MLLLFVQLCFNCGKAWEQFRRADTDKGTDVCIATVYGGIQIVQT